MRSSIRLLIALLAVLAPAHGGMQKLREVRFANSIKEPSGWPPLKYHAVQSLAFSADSKWLAVSIDDHQTRTTIGTHVFLLDTAEPSGLIRQYDIDACGAPIEWAPDGDAILVCTSVIKLPDGQTCSILGPRPVNAPPQAPILRGLNGIARWLDSRRIWREDASGVLVLNENCAARPTRTDDLTARRAATRRTPPEWPPAQLKEYKVIDVSLNPSRVLAEERGNSFIAHFDIDPWPTVRRRVVWDIEERRVIASWNPQGGHPYGQSMYLHPYRNCTLSPDGSLVAEGDNGALRLYRLN
jgi:hypothetical protein